MMKWRATGLLLVVAAVFIVVRTTTDSDGWAGYVEAAAEAAMVGGVADWFAVTALFRHPLGIPIPHTAIIPNRKDQIGRSLGTFVQENFLSAEQVSARLVEYDVAGRAGAWLADERNARRVGEQTSAVVGGVTGALGDDAVAAGIEDALRRRLEALPVASLAAHAVDSVIEGGQHQAALDAALQGIEHAITENDLVLRRRIYNESPWWVPASIDDRVFDRIVDGVHGLVTDVLADPNHEVRQLFDERVRGFAVQLRTSPAMIARAETLKRELLDHPEVRGWLESVWDHTKAGILEAADNPDSELRQRLEAGIVQAGKKLGADPELRGTVNQWADGVVRYAIEQTQGEVAHIISSTVERWDPQQTGARIELQVGRDLQFIRINGTVVGGLVGVLIHAVGEFL